MLSQLAGPECRKHALVLIGRRDYSRPLSRRRREILLRLRPKPPNPVECVNGFSYLRDTRVATSKAEKTLKKALVKWGRFHLVVEAEAVDLIIAISEYSSSK